ncbi:hypothetical protein C0989_009826, partial [Termitomyces sp. Mn162]
STKTGPLLLFHHAGKLVPHLANPFLKLNTGFLKGLMAANLLNVSYMAGARECNQEDRGLEEDGYTDEESDESGDNKKM